MRKNPMMNVKNASTFAKDKQKYSIKDTWGKLLKYCKPYLVAIIIALTCVIGGKILAILAPDKLSDMTAEISVGLSGNMNFDAILNIALILVLFYAGSIVLTYVESLIMAILAQKVSKKMRTDISKKINKLPLKYYDNHNIGDTLSRVTNDVDTIGQTLSQSIGMLVSSVVLFLGSLTMMFITNWILAVVAICATLIGFFAMALVMSRSQKYFTAQQEYLGKLNGHIEETYAGHNVIKAYNAEDKMNKQFDEYNGKLYTCAWKSQFLSGLMMPFMSFIGNFGYVAVCVAGAILTLNGVIGFEVIVAFMIYIRLFTQPLSQIAQAFSSLQQTTAASYRVFEFLSEEEIEDETSKNVRLSTTSGNIDFKNVKFGYNSEKTIINDFSISIKSGQKVAIVGPTGAGKTTMVNLLMRFYEIDGGQILIDGVPIKDLSRENVHNLFCMVLQDTWLFEGSIKDNIKFNNPNITDEEIVKACKAVGVHHFIQTLANGYDTILNEEANISVGQKQLLTIARAMIQNAPMLILDEATSSVDTRTEILIQKAMDKLMQGRTSIIIAHRLSTIKNADLILVMKDGDIIESGNHKELLKQKGFYAELYNSQFEEN
ncbi:MAG: ABC transporter ATP-binding protein [Clostridia bacterium]|nr:ABC transporter ATP-binding protein [Clostridia bacterium]